MSDTRSVKAQSRELIDSLPETASWDDVMYALYVREAVERGLKEGDAGRTWTTDEVRAHLRDVPRGAS
jgi:predicted transcriptional regulator